MVSIIIEFKGILNKAVSGGMVNSFLNVERGAVHRRDAESAKMAQRC
jgi:hypothetical protein